MGRFQDEGNILVSNQSKNVLVNYNFMLRVEGIYDLPCKAVHSFTKENEFEYVQEGGLNDYVHMLRKPVSKPFSFTVERYVGMDIVPPLPLGAELILPVILMIAPNANQFGRAKRTFVFTGCTVMSKTFGELNAEKSELLTETIVIGYREMTEVTVPVHAGSDGPLWEFDGVNVDGNSVKSARRLADNGTATLRRWLVEKGSNTEGVQSAKKYTDIFKQEETQGDDDEKVTIRKSNIKHPPDTGEAKKRQWLMEEGSNTEGVQSAKKYTDIFKQEEEQKEEEALEKKPTVKKGPDTGKANKRQWITEKGSSTKSVQSAKKYTDIFKQEENQKENEALEKKPTVKKGPDTGEAEVRKTGIKKGPDTGEAEVRKTGIKKGPDTGKPEVRKTGIKKGPDTGEAEVRKTGIKKGPDTGKPEDRKTGIKKGPDTGEAEVRKTGIKEGSDTGEAKKRQWITEEGSNIEGVQSAKQSPDTGEAEVRKTQIKKGSDTGKALVRRWPPTRSAATLTEKNK